MAYAERSYTSKNSADVVYSYVPLSSDLLSNESGFLKSFIEIHFKEQNLY